MTLEHGLKRTIPSRGIAHALYQRAQHPAVPRYVPEKRGGIAGWLARFWNLILGVPHVDF